MTPKTEKLKLQKETVRTLSQNVPSAGTVLSTGCISRSNCQACWTE